MSAAVLQYASPTLPQTADRPHTPLADTLAALHIRPFTLESVQAYKLQEQRKANRGIFWPNLARLVAWCSVPSVILCVVLFVAILACIIGAKIQGEYLNHSVTISSFWIQTELRLFICIVVCVIIITLLNGKTVRLPAHWDLEYNVRHSKGIPDFTWQRGQTILRERPDATLDVERLKRGEKVLDPFLIVRLGSERYYIAVWDEAGFNLEPDAS